MALNTAHKRYIGVDATGVVSASHAVRPVAGGWIRVERERQSVWEQSLCVLSWCVVTWSALECVVCVCFP